MNGLKKQFIKSFLKLTILENKPGILKIQMAKLSGLDTKYRVYERYVARAIKLLGGIEDIDIVYETNSITVHYNEQAITAQKIYNWIQEILDVVLNNLEFIEQYAQKHVEYTTEGTQHTTEYANHTTEYANHTIEYALQKLEQVLRRKVISFNK